MKLLILGLGNLLCEDDGLGVEAVRRLVEGWEPPEDALLLDGGTLGLALLGWLAEAETAILVDAVAADAPPGTLVRLEGEDVAAAALERLSVHQVGVADLLLGARLVERAPARILLHGIVPARTRVGVERSSQVEASLPALVDAIVAEADRLGFRFRRRSRAA